MEDDISASDAVGLLLLVLDVLIFRYLWALPLWLSQQSVLIMRHHAEWSAFLLADKKLPSTLDIRIADTASQALNHIVSTLYEVLISVGLIMDEQAAAATTVQSTFTVLNSLLKNTFKEKHIFPYGAVVSLLHDIELILRSELQFGKGDIQILYDNLSMMHSLLIDSSVHGYDQKVMISLENWINFVAYRVRDYIDSGPQISTEESPTDFLYSSEDIPEDQLRALNRRLECINEELMGLTEEQGAGQVFNKLNKCYPKCQTGGKLVGFKDDLSLMLDRLTGHPPKLQVLAVLGMGGIGKTTFTESLYDDPLVRYHFHIRAWITISQQYQVKEMLIGLLCCLTDPMAKIYDRLTDDELKQMVYQRLKGMKYLIVVDDMWDKQAWNDLKNIFPDDVNGSRIILTTRLREVAIFASQDTLPHCLPHLNPDESWKLLCSKILINELCPPELEPIGKQIACKCQGLPLAIVVISGLLSKMKMTLEVWKEVAESVPSIVMDKKEQCQKILALSYNHLPYHLKPCFLYMGIFPEDSKITPKKLIWLWIAEGFIRHGELHSLEELAENYLEDLIGRSLIQVNKRRYDGRFKACFLHDMLRDLCLKELHEKRFFLVCHKDLESMTLDEKKKFMRECRRFCFHSNTFHTYIPFLSNIHSFLWFKTITSIDLKDFSYMNPKHLKVLDIIGHIDELPEAIVPMQANFRYLALSFRKSIDRSVFCSTFNNIQILIVEGEWNGLLPKEFWTMAELRHFYLKRSFLSYWPEESRPNIIQLALALESPQPLIYPVQYEEHSIKVLQNLRSLTTMRPISCTRAVFLAMPNLKKLGVYENEEDYGFRGWLINLVHLKQLQSLKYVFRDPFVAQPLKPHRFPSRDFILKELINLTISGTGFPWEDMLKLIDALPKLELLKLKKYAFFGTTWTIEPEMAGFPCLKYLLIGSTNLHSWAVDGTHFPMLQHLVMMNCRLLEEIPYGIFEAPLLERIELHNCSDTAADSAEQAQQELLDNGNDSLELHITPDRRQRYDHQKSISKISFLLLTFSMNLQVKLKFQDPMHGWISYIYVM
ncbi:hypothetical protein F511_07034 [Dorcoceras hygrometricum]|uniref:Uncharacterized protein n=1 Tax=Dorcoceras hygrometricum TaxID=472368 RepID=A0A2Z7D6X8_9LAMI|nr:hypothetical protein F511_07034 [Dorcoceras hygrometricum]